MATAMGRIRAAARSGSPSLDLSGLGLTELPESVGQLTGLAALDVGRNYLTVLPDSIGQLSQLKWLYLGTNQLAVLPESIGCLTNLEQLFLAGNRLTKLPDSIGQLTSLTRLFIGNNRLTAVPSSIGQLNRLTELNAGDNELTSLPDSIGRLTELTWLYLSDNGLTVLPESIGQLTKLTELHLERNRLRELPESIGQLAELTELRLGRSRSLTYPPAAVLAEGGQAVLAFLRGGRTAAQRQWRSKLLLVGEGGAGKTTLLKVLSGGVADPFEQTTHGLNIQDLALPHPERPGIMMSLAAWDFGGQHVYHATHQFFLTDQSLFLLLWNSRAGWDQAKGRYWLDIIDARTRRGPDQPAAPVILVATHSQNRAPDLPLTELRRDYPNIVASVEIDSLADSETGIDQLRDLISESASRLPLMGQSWPTSWLAAQQAVRESDRKRLGSEQFQDLLATVGVTDEPDQQAVTGTLHQLGEVLHFAEDPNLDGTVVLKPAWLSERIAAILDCDSVAERHGLLLAEDIAREWTDLGSELQQQLLFMMDRYDISYRVTGGTANARAIVVDRLPHEPPDYNADWVAFESPINRELQLHYVLSGTIPPGIPGWFIARAHRFATTPHRPWRTGAVLAHPDGRHLALLRLDQRANTVKLAVRGPHPAGFLGVLDLEFTETLRRYPGLLVTRAVPCPCQQGCSTNWPFDKLTHLLDTLGQPDVQCIETGRRVDISTLIDGISPARSANDAPAIVAASMARVEARIDEMSALVLQQGILQQEQAEQLHLGFAKVMGWLQVSTPTVFTVTEKPLHAPGTHRYVLRLYCAEPNAIHQLPDNKGCYPITALDKWAATLIRHLSKVAGLLSPVSGLAGPILHRGAPDLLGRNGDDLKKIHETIASLKQSMTALEDRDTVADIPVERATSEADARRIEELLRAVDPHRHWGGLTKTVTPSGITLYLCEDHARAYAAPSPRPQGL